MPQIEQTADQVSEQLPWEAPQLVKAEVSTVTQLIRGAGDDGTLGS